MTSKSYIINNLVSRMSMRGFRPSAVEDEENVTVIPAGDLSDVMKKTLDTVMAVDISRIVFQRDDLDRNRISFLIVLPNSGIEIIADHTAHPIADTIMAELEKMI